jgi:hypothetical protein
MKNYKVWNKHGEQGENLPEKVSCDTVRALIIACYNTELNV